MKKTYLALALLITGFLLAGNAYGEDEVYYCADEKGAGFIFKETTNSYQMSRDGLVQQRFKMKLDRANKRIELVLSNSSWSFACTQPFLDLEALHFSSSFACTSSFYMFNFNPDNGRYVFSQGFGHVNSDGDTVAITIGKCDKF
jgi:hypothetical protein